MAVWSSCYQGTPLPQQCRQPCPGLPWISVICMNQRRKVLALPLLLPLLLFVAKSQEPRAGSPYLLLLSGAAFFTSSALSDVFFVVFFPACLRFLAASVAQRFSSSRMFLFFIDTRLHKRAIKSERA